MHPFLTDLYHLVVDTLLPVRCASCKTETNKALCPRCLQGLRTVEADRCIACTKASSFGLTHPECRTRHSPARLLYAFDYGDKTISESIIAGKYSFVKDVFVELGNALASQLHTDLSALNSGAVLVAPLPLHKRRQRWRGFNQSAILAKTLAMHMGFAYEELLLRTRSTKTQKNLKKDRRKTNVADCFALSGTPDLNGKTVLIVDDVTTTGSTLLEAAKTLKEHGAATVWCIALAQD